MGPKSLEQELSDDVAKSKYANCVMVELDGNYIICHRLCSSRRGFETAVAELTKVWRETVREYGRCLGVSKWDFAGLRIPLGFEPET